MCSYMWVFTIPIKVDPNDVDSTVDSDVEVHKSDSIFIFTMFNGLKCLQVKKYFGNNY